MVGVELLQMFWKVSSCSLQTGTEKKSEILKASQDFLYIICLILPVLTNVLLVEEL